MDIFFDVVESKGIPKNKEVGHAANFRPLANRIAYSSCAEKLTKQIDTFMGQKE